MKTAAGLGR